MNKQLIPLFLLMSAILPAMAQDRNSLKQQLQDAQPLTASTISWITTGRDIPNQDNRSEAEIDKEIDQIIQSQRTKNVLDIQTPINAKKLICYGKIDIRQLGLLSDNSVFASYPNEYKEADSSKYIYKYGNIIVQTTSNTYRDQFYVYAIIRAFLILKNKYPEIHKVLIKRTESVQFGADVNRTMNPANTVYLNANKHYIITVHENNTKLLPATTTNYGWGGYVNSKAVNNGNFIVTDNNNHFIFFNSSTMKNGGAAPGNKNIYSHENILDREINYALDGLLQTLVHERMHNYIGLYQGVDQFLNYIRNDNSLLNGGYTYDLLEEPAVTNTTNQIFKRYGGISNDVMKYYADLFSIQLETMKGLPGYEALIGKLKTLNNLAVTDVHRIVRLNIFDFGQQQMQQLPPQSGGQQPHH